MSQSSWSSIFGFGRKSTTPTTTNDPAPPPTEEETSSPLCCKALAQSALQQAPTYWPRTPKYQHLLKDFLTWIDTTGFDDEDAEWVDIASSTDLNKADFAITILPDRSPSETPLKREEKFFIPLSNHSFTHINSPTSTHTFNSSSYLDTGNKVHITCPDCGEGFKISFRVKRGRQVDIQLVDIPNAGTRAKVEEMMKKFPGRRVDDLRSELYRKVRLLKEEAEEAEKGKGKGKGKEKEKEG